MRGDDVVRLVFKGTMLAALLALAYLLGYAAGELDRVDRDPL